MKPAKIKIDEKEVITEFSNGTILVGGPSRDFVGCPAWADMKTWVEARNEVAELLGTNVYEWVGKEEEKK